MRRMVMLVVAVALTLPFVLYLKGPAAAATDRLPDLRMAHPIDLKVENTPDGRRLLRFSSIIVNVGDGPFEAHGRRPDASTSTMTVRQRIYNDAGSFRGVSTPAIMKFGGDGHNHWHVRNLEKFSLIRLDNGVKVGTGAKHGFCFFDNYRFGSTQAPHYTIARGACGKSTDLRVKMGLSVGWGDIYHYTLPDQYIDITGLTSGNYRLRATADAQNWFVEKNNTNNHTWINIKLSGNSVSVVRYGPGA